MTGYGPSQIITCVFSSLRFPLTSRHSLRCVHLTHFYLLSCPCHSHGVHFIIRAHNFHLFFFFFFFLRYLSPLLPSIFSASAINLIRPHWSLTLACNSQSYATKTNRFARREEARCAHFFVPCTRLLFLFLFLLVWRVGPIFNLSLSLSRLLLLSILRAHWPQFLLPHSLSFSIQMYRVHCITSSARVTRLLEGYKSAHKMSQPPVDTCDLASSA